MAGRRNSTYRLGDSPEVTGGGPTLSTASVSNNLTLKKRKSPSKYISSQKKYRDIVEGDSSQSPATDASSQAEAATLKLHRKGNKKYRDSEAAVSKVSGYSSTDCNDVTITPGSLEDRKLNVACQSLNTEAVEPVSCNQSQDTKTKKRKRSKEKSAASICEANEAVMKIDKAGSFNLDTVAANGSVVKQNIASAPSTICDQSMEPKEEKRKKRSKSKKLVSNDGGNCGAIDISSQEKSHQGGDLSLSVVSDKCNQAAAEVSQPQRKKHNKDGSTVNRDIDSAPSTVWDQTMEPKEKKRKKRSKSEKLVSNDDGNYGANDISSQEKSHQGGDLSLSVVSDKCNQAVAEVSQPQRKKHNEDGSIVNRDIGSVLSTVCDQTMETKAKKIKKPRKSKKFMDSVSNADKSHQVGDLSLSVVSDTGKAVAEVLQQQRKKNDNTGSIVNQDVDSAPSAACDKSMEPEGKKRKKRGNRGKKKSKEINDSISNADTIPELDGISSQEKASVGRNVNLPSLSSRKLVILDLNGLLADIRSEPLEGSKPDKQIMNRAVYKRPFCDDFVQFCFETFDVAVWSSRKRMNVQHMLNFLMKQDLRKKLIFTRDQCQCTKTGFMTIENKDKPIFLKELQRVWKKSKRVYNKSNTLLIDDSPYKALRNPPYTGIFPNTYECSNTDDNSLGPNGDLRLYLKRLAEADNVQEFVKENPFGQIPITDSHPSWDFYSKVLAPKPPSMKKKTVFGNVVPQ